MREAVIVSTAGNPGTQYRTTDRTRCWPPGNNRRHFGGPAVFMCSFWTKLIDSRPKLLLIAIRGYLTHVRQLHDLFASVATF